MTKKESERDVCDDGFCNCLKTLKNRVIPLNFDKRGLVGHF